MSKKIEKYLCRNELFDIKNIWLQAKYEGNHDCEFETFVSMFVGLLKLKTINLLTENLEIMDAVEKTHQKIFGMLEECPCESIDDIAVLEKKIDAIPTHDDGVAKLGENLEIINPDLMYVSKKLISGGI